MLQEILKKLHLGQDEAGKNKNLAKQAICRLADGLFISYKKSKISSYILEIVTSSITLDVVTILYCSKALDFAFNLRVYTGILSDLGNLSL